MKNTMRLTGLLCVTVLLSNIAAAQTYEVDTTQSSLSVAGTSTLHDWESMAEEYYSSANLTDQNVTDISLTVSVKSIKSGKAGMDNNTYNALNADEFPEIKFQSDVLTREATSLKGTGELTIKAVTKEITLDLQFEELSADSFKVSGEIPLTMTEYGVIPPTAMLGAIKTGDDITIKFDLTMTK